MEDLSAFRTLHAFLTLKLHFFLLALFFSDSHLIKIIFLWSRKNSPEEGQ